ncbi:MAG: UPF0182 family protein [Candidatus Microthrix sp.]|nr:UPF0182 family protein [Candidatus Microthrix sp.]MBK6501093.1 UPF0182 family protein [Candidatus Microthrix sp.]
MAVATNTERAFFVAFVENRSKVQRTALVVIAAVAATLFSLRAIAQQALNMWWFRTVSDVPIWRTSMLARIQLGALAMVVTLGVVGTSVWWAHRQGSAEPDRPKGRMLKWYEAKMGPGHRWLLVLAPVVFALWETRRVASRWQVWLLYREGRPTGAKVPYLGGDVGDYLFKLPFWNLVTTWLSWMLVGAAALSLLVYLVNRRISLRHFVSRSEQKAVAHMAVLLGLLAIVKAIDFMVVQRMSLAMSTSGSFVGAGYTELHVQLTTLNTLALIGFLVGILCLANVRWRVRRLAVIAGALWGIVAVIGLYLMPGIILRLKVNPQEAIVERPYVETNLAATRAAFSLDDIKEHSLEDAPTPPPSLQVPGSAGSAKGLPARVPLLDSDRYAPTFQVLEGRTAVRVTNVDVDRYDIDGAIRPVLLAARSSDAGGLPQGGWEQKHLVFTHGDGLAVAPADAVRPDGRPDFDVLADKLQIDHPELYFGEGVKGWYAIVGTGRAQQNGATFDADTGMEINSLWKRGALAFSQSELDPLFSDYITEDSQLLYRRDINERLHAMAPFLKWGSDPYPVVSDGRITWVIDGFTSADTYPNSQFASRAEPGRRLRSQPGSVQLHPCLGQGHHRRLRRFGHDVPNRASRRERPDPRRLEPGVPGGVHADRQDAGGYPLAPSLPDRPAQGTDQPARSISRDRPGSVPRRQSQLDCVGRPGQQHRRHRSGTRRNPTGPPGAGHRHRPGSALDVGPTLQPGFGGQRQLAPRRVVRLCACRQRRRRIAGPVDRSQPRWILCTAAVGRSLGGAGRDQRRHRVEPAVHAAVRRWIKGELRPHDAGAQRRRRAVCASRVCDRDR